VHLLVCYLNYKMHGATVKTVICVLSWFLNFVPVLRLRCLFSSAILLSILAFSDLLLCIRTVSMFVLYLCLCAGFAVGNCAAVGESV
jgi:hypothetical protein